MNEEIVTVLDNLMRGRVQAPLPLGRDNDKSLITDRRAPWRGMNCERASPSI